MKRRWLAVAALAAPAACAAAPDHVALVGGTVVGVGPAAVELAGGKIVAIGAAPAGVPQIDVTGKWLAPAFVDSHVHLAYLPQGPALAAGGIAAAVDLASPMSFFAQDPGVRVLRAGPMVTAVGGYPLDSWGANGYGLACTDAKSARAAVESLVAAGAGVIKLPVTGPPVLDAAALAAAADAAHAHGLKVASHALSDAEAAAAAVAGADVLAHTPTEPLSDATIALWSGRAVISTLAAFGGGPDTVENLRKLRAAGATVLYGTDFGNTTYRGIDPTEISLLRTAGLDGAAILAAGTATPAAYWGFTDLGALAPGKAASLLVLGEDPTKTPATLGHPEQVWLDGQPQR